jgi:hypothetical protein
MPKESLEDIVIMRSIEGVEEVEESDKALPDRGIFFLEKDRALYSYKKVATEPQSWYVVAKNVS